MTQSGQQLLVPSRLCCLLPWFVVLGWLSGTARSVEPPATVRVLTYNIHHGESTAGKLDLSRIAAVVRESGADVVALQEVDRHVPRSGGVDQAAELASQLDMHAVFAANISLDGGEYGNAVLSKWKVRLIANHLLPNLNDGEQRGVLEVEIAWPRESPLRLLATHLDHRRDEAERLKSAEMINELEAREPGAWTLLAGDINAVPESQTLSILNMNWQISDSQLAPTIPSDKPSRKIDYIFTQRGQDLYTLRCAQVLDEKTASDHRPLLAVFDRNNSTTSMPTDEPAGSPR